MLIRPNTNKAFKGSHEFVIPDAMGRSKSMVILRRTYALDEFVPSGKYNAKFGMKTISNPWEKEHSVYLSTKQMNEMFMAFAVIEREYQTLQEFTYDY